MIAPAPSPPDGARFRGTRLGDPSLEEAYRLHFLSADGRTAAMLLGAFAFAVAVYAVPDWLMLGGGAVFWRVLALRALYVTATIGIVTWAMRTSSWRRFDLVLVGAMVLLQGMMFLSGTTRPRGFYMQIAIDVAVVNAIWTILPVRFNAQVWSAAIFVLGQALLLRFFRDPLPVPLRGPVIFAYVIAHGVGAAVAWRYHRVRRREWLALRRIEGDRANLAVAREQAERANRAKSVFLAGVSHEILTPLNAILGFSDVLRRREPRPEDRQPLEAIHASATTLHGLLGDVLDMARGEAAEAPLSPRPTAVDAIIADVGKIMAPRAAERGVELRVCPTDAPGVAVDADRLRQVLLNLAANAIRFTRTGSVTIAQAATARPDGRVDVEVSVRDTGEGIPPDELASIFEPFRQRRGQDPRYGGTGLGLALSRHLVGRMGGRVEVESVVGVGSTFRVLLPGLEPARSPRAVDGGTRWELAPCAVVVADDEPWNRTLVRSYLERQPVRVLEAEDGLAAHELARREGVRVVLLDVQMPRMDGLTAAGRLRAELGGECPGIVMTSAQPQGPEGPWDGWLRKPFSETALMDAIGPLVPGSRRVRAAAPAASGPVQHAGIDPAWTAEAALLADAPHAGRARALADRVGGAARAAGDASLSEWAAATRAAADSLDLEALSALLRKL